MHDEVHVRGPRVMGDPSEFLKTLKEELDRIRVELRNDLKEASNG